jgi:hypothetical protein
MNEEIPVKAGDYAYFHSGNVHSTIVVLEIVDDDRMIVYQTLMCGGPEQTARCFWVDGRRNMARRSWQNTGWIFL